ncbi:MAG: tRNA (adenosine(37)-N6)-threonylcarbamoyltransferase complex transferase subunit TsaD [Lentisphaeria bacterium]|nr:tRNA (adenosine(37)-N6)-threonylcarbamoyltransferase complex transferase subunit TsaD [Lentisphaeria bacterium]
MNVLGIETSCDETAAAVVVDGVEVKSNVVSSQIDKHAAFGGVVPELAAREHLNNISVVVETALSESGLTISDIDAVAATCRPGLVPALLVGLSYAKGLAAAGSLPLVGVNHFVGHIYSCFLQDPDLLTREDLYPLVALVVSGGHTSIISISAEGETEILGQTIDDAAGEAFDKAAKILDLGYPGGPVIDRLAKAGDPAAIDFPRSLTGGNGKPVSAENRFNFSFSGVKTALLYAVRDKQLSDQEIKDVVASYQAAIVDVLAAKTFAAAAALNAGSVLVCGGVACNSALRTVVTYRAEKEKRRLVIAPAKYCTDNAVMIAGTGYHMYAAGMIEGLETPAKARLGDTLGCLPFTPLAGV